MGVDKRTVPADAPDESGFGADLDAESCPLSAMGLAEPSLSPLSDLLGPRDTGGALGASFGSGLGGLGGGAGLTELESMSVGLALSSGMGMGRLHAPRPSGEGARGSGVRARADLAERAKRAEQSMALELQRPRGVLPTRYGGGGGGGGSGGGGGGGSGSRK